jgi:hypothetical protein
MPSCVSGTSYLRTTRPVESLFGQMCRQTERVNATMTSRATSSDGCADASIATAEVQLPAAGRRPPSSVYLTGGGLTPTISRTPNTPPRSDAMPAIQATALENGE